MQGEAQQFFPGDRVLRVSQSVFGVEEGHVYTVAGTRGEGFLSLIGFPNRNFSPCNFKRVDRWTPEGPYKVPTNTTKVPTNTTKESDPTGIDQHAPGAKLDNGKPRPSLVIEGMARAIMAVSKVATFGANKYSDNGWVEVPNGEARYADAGYRHMLKRAMGEEVDEDSKELHLVHEAWNALAKLDLFLRNKEKSNAST